MKQKEWIEIVRKAMDLRRARNIPQAIQLLQKQIRLLRKSMSTLDLWHEGEALTLIAFFCEDQKNYKRAAQFYIKAATLHRDSATSHIIAASERFARASILYFEIGAKQKAFDISKHAFDSARLDSDPSPTYEKLLQKVREYHFERAEKKRKK